jgi:hypothetical protein
MEAGRMNRSLRVVIASGVLLVAGSAWAQQSQNAAGFSSVSDRDGNDVSYSGIVSPTAAEKTNPEGASACDCNDCCGQSCCDHHCCDDCCCNECCPCWTVEAGAVIMQRGDPRSALVLVNQNIGPEDPINARDFTFNWEAGPDISVIRTIGGGSNAIDVRFFGVNDWTASQSVASNGVGYILTTNPPIPLFGPVTAMYTSRLYSAEINWEHTASDRLTWLAGFRWLQVNENLNFLAPTPPAFGPVDVAFNTNNNLFGGQIGADISLWDRGGPFSVDSIFKAGIYGNGAHNNTNYTGFPFGQALLAADDSGQVAFVGEIDLAGVYQWTDHIALRAGWEFMWIDGAALASDQVGATNVNIAVGPPPVGNGINTKGEVFYQGALVSLDITW